MIAIDPEDYNILMDILKKYPFTIYAYGSRAKGTNRRFSDLDLGIFDDNEQTKDKVRSDLFDLKDDLGESNLPFTVDVALWNRMNKDFQDLIKPDLVLL